MKEKAFFAALGLIGIGGLILALNFSFYEAIGVVIYVTGVTLLFSTLKHHE